MIEVNIIFYADRGEETVSLAAKRTLSRKSVEKLIFIKKDEETNEWIIETLRRQHFSVWEFSWYVFEVSGCSRVCSHQLVRHRLASYAQLSQRYSDHMIRYVAEYAQGVSGVRCAKRDYGCYARAVRGLIERGGDKEVLEAVEKAFVIPPTLDREKRAVVARQYLGSVVRYYELMARGVRAEDARYALPQAVKTRILVAMNAREIMHFLGLRMCTRAQWEIRTVAWLLWRELMKIHPRLFKWAGPRCVQVENLVREDPRPLEDYLEGRAQFTIARCPEGVRREAIPQCLRLAASVLWNSGSENPSDSP